MAFSSRIKKIIKKLECCYMVIPCWLLESENENVLEMMEHLRLKLRVDCANMG